MINTALATKAAMKKDQQYVVSCQLTLADLEYGRVVRTHQIQQNIASQTAEIHELLTDLYEQFRSPYLLGLQITSIRSSRQPAEHVFG